MTFGPDEHIRAATIMEDMVLLARRYLLTQKIRFGDDVPMQRLSLAAPPGVECHRSR
jgi:hypothetical protein